MVEHENVRSLGQSISTALTNQTNKSTEAEKAYDPIVYLKKGEQAFTPIFCIPGAGNNVVNYASLVNALDDDWPIYGLQPRGLDGKLIPHTSVFAAAHFYLDAIRRIYSNGPFHLLGHSFGGWVALEMALHQARIGEPVSSLNIIDSAVPNIETSELEKEYTHNEALMKLIYVFELSAGRTLDISINDLDHRDPADQLGLIHTRMKDVGLMSPRSSAHDLLGPVQAFGACIRTLYRPTAFYPYEVNLIVLDDIDLTSEKALAHRFMKRVTGWRQCAEHVKYWRGPGNHMTALKPPHVDKLARWIKQEIEPKGSRKERKREQ